MAKKIIKKTSKKQIKKTKASDKKVIKSKVKTTSKTVAKTMEDLIKNTGYTFTGLKKGKEVEGIITDITKKTVLIDIGAKTEGVIINKEFEEVVEFVDELKVGDKIKAIVVSPENDKGQILLSVKQTALDYKWDLFDQYLKTEKTWKNEIQKWFKQGAPMSLERGHEFAAYIINAFCGGEPYIFNGNVPNTGIITNLPYGACVEVPVLANKRGFNPIYVGALPPQCATLDYINISVEQMAVESILTGDATLLFQSIAYDPLTAAVLSLAEIKKMVGEMMLKNRKYMPQFKNIKSLKA